MACRLCHLRRPRRFCPGIGSDICAPCCGTARETTIDCPLDFEYLREARKREKPAPFDPETAPDRDIRVTEQFLREHEPLAIFLAREVANAGFAVPGAADPDVREALAALARTFRTLESGVIYERRPENPRAAAIYEAAQAAVPEFRRREQQEFGMQRTRDADVLGVWVFLERLGLANDHGRPRGRAFLEMLWGAYGEGAPSPRPASSLILP